ncbi:MAG: gliding-motility protein MglA [Polyangiaceae bacterium]|nr:gliding-motility protein MglA [Polyangiaceae bacterium]
MPIINYPLREIGCKIVYYGPGMCGKTTNVARLHAGAAATARGRMISLETRAERTLFFDFMPLDIGEIRGFSVRLHIYTVPGQIWYAATRRLILRGADGLVFVADSQKDRMDANVLALEDLREGLAEQGTSLARVPHVLQYNKRDLPGIVSVEELRAALNPDGAPDFEGAASRGAGVVDTLRGVSRLVLSKLGR